MGTASRYLTHYFSPFLSLHVVSEVFSCQIGIVTYKDV
jgi:hypothetical protein